MLVTVLALLLLAALGYALYTHLNKDTIKRDANGVSVERTQQDLKLEEELKNDASRKQQATQTDRPSEPAVDEKTNLQKANVVLTNAGYTDDSVSASGFVSNIVEQTGSCKYVFTSGERVIEKSSGTLVNSSSTTCKTVEFPKSELGAGPWKVHIVYSSDMAYGKSNELEVR